MFWYEARCFTPDHVLRYYDVVCDPVDPFSFVRPLRIQLSFDDMDASGVVVTVDKHAFMKVSTRDPLVRQRFTVAHELGHLLLHDVSKGHVDVFTPGLPADVMEREANVFAAKLLMPEWMIRPAVDQVGADVAVLAKRFVVSESAMELRLRALYR